MRASLLDLITMASSLTASGDGGGHGLDDRAGAGSGRRLQFQIPNYTSPPTDLAIFATPSSCRDDACIDAARALDAEGGCFTNATTAEGRGDGSSSPSSAVDVCQLLFPPPPPPSPQSAAEIGVVIYGGGLVDPRAYSPLARTIADRYGMPVSIPIFHRDIAVSDAYLGGSEPCDSGRVPLASAAFPYVRRWILVGHSLGGIAAAGDLRSEMMGSTLASSAPATEERQSSSASQEGKIGGLVLLGSYLRRDRVGACGPLDFSDTTIPMAIVSASLDLIVNSTNWRNGLELLPANDTQFVDILGGNHALFGSYDDSRRVTVLNQTDGEATVPEVVQRDMSAAAVAHVAARLGLALPSSFDPLAERYGEAPVAFDSRTTPTTMKAASSSAFRLQNSQKTESSLVGSLAVTAAALLFLW